MSHTPTTNEATPFLTLPPTLDIWGDSYEMSQTCIALLSSISCGGTAILQADILEMTENNYRAISFIFTALAWESNAARKCWRVWDMYVKEGLSTKSGVLSQLTLALKELSLAQSYLRDAITRLEKVLMHSAFRPFSSVGDTLVSQAGNRIEQLNLVRTRLTSDIDYLCMKAEVPLTPDFTPFSLSAPTSSDQGV